MNIHLFEGHSSTMASRRGFLGRSLPANALSFGA